MATKKRTKKAEPQPTVETRQMLVSKLSYTSFTLFLRNPMIFKLREILGVYDSKSGVSGMIGKACHEALKFYYGSHMDRVDIKDVAEARGVATDVGLKWLDLQPDEMIKFGKTGSREGMIAGYTQAMRFYWAEEPKYHKVVYCEEKFEAVMKTDSGETLPLPGVGKPDLVIEDADGGIDIVDAKIVTSFTDYETEDYIKIIQAQFMYHLLLAATGLKARRMLFREIKRTENKDGKPQIRDYAIPYDHDAYKIFFYNLYRDVVKYISNPDALYLPNLSDPFDGEQAGMIYAQGLISSDMSDVEVMHKVRDVAYTTKQFVASRLDSDLNKNLLPEEKIKMCLSEYGILVEPEETKVGAAVTQYRFKLARGISGARVKKYKDDIARALETKGEVRIVSPIPGTNLLGVEVENKNRTAATLKGIKFSKNTLNIPIGMSVDDEAIFVPLNEMPHLLIAGATGSGKSVFLHSTLHALTSQMTPQNMRLVLIDPKRVELSTFAKMPHVEGKVIYEYKEAVMVLAGLTETMEERYKMLEKAGVRDIKEYNATRTLRNGRMPYIVLVIDEFADLMIKSKKNDVDTETLIVRLAAMARAVGIHMIIATQRPSVDVITGLIKANFPTRIALTTASPTDSVVILGQPGAEKLSGKGDLLFSGPAVRGLLRLQGFKS